MGLINIIGIFIGAGSGGDTDPDGITVDTTSYTVDSGLITADNG